MMIKGFTLGPILEYIGDKCETIKKAMPSLKFCRGEPFGEDHWCELLQGKLKLNKDVKLVNLKVEHFLLSLHILSEPTTVLYVKQLQARAQVYYLFKLIKLHYIFHILHLQLWICSLSINICLFSIYPYLFSVSF